MSIYTKTGDKMFTDIKGERVRKDNKIIDTMGTIDELLVKVSRIKNYDIINYGNIETIVNSISKDLYMVNSYLAGYIELSINSEKIESIEKEIDIMNDALPVLKGFLKLDGTNESLFVHEARVICRKVERKLISLSDEVHIDELLIKYINRLSDYFFVLARYINNVLGYTELYY